MLERHFVVSPAYGRDYKTGQEAKDAWNEGKDFIHNSRVFLGGGTYISNRNCVRGDVIEIRYHKKMHIAIVKVL